MNIFSWLLEFVMLWSKVKVPTVAAGHVEDDQGVAGHEILTRGPCLEHDELRIRLRDGARETPRRS